MKTVHQKKRGRPATGRDPLVSLRIPPKVAAGVATFVADQPDPKPSRSEALRIILSDWLTGHGYMEQP